MEVPTPVELPLEVSPLELPPWSCPHMEVSPAPWSCSWRCPPPELPLEVQRGRGPKGRDEAPQSFPQACPLHASHLLVLSSRPCKRPVF